MSRRAGFTLLELTVAIAVTGIVALLVYGTVAVAVDTETRLEAHERVARSERAWHALVEDALRNLRSNADYGRATLILTSGTDLQGRPRDRLAFITAGGTPPLTPDADWSVSIEVGVGGIEMAAAPLGIDAPARRVVALPGVTGLDVRVFGGLPRPAWLEEWSDRRMLPRAIEITYRTDSGPAGPPVLLTLPAGSAP